jgi:hypothetical protein
MLLKEELAAIQKGFAAYKLYAAEHGGHLEIGYYEVAAYQIGQLVKAHVKTLAHAEAYAWLINVIFTQPAKVAFVTAKEAYIHVMAALDTLVAVAGEYFAGKAVAAQ